MRNLFWSLVIFVPLLLADSSFAQWQPPVGVPSPSFGIVNDAPARPVPWSNPVTGYYYVDATITASTDTSNPYGTPARPRKTIPIVLPAGSVVELHGAYAYAHGSPRGIVSSGTAAAPVYIRGQSATQKPNVSSCWETSGSYYIVENIEFSGCGNILVLAPTHHAAVRHTDVHGTSAGGGLGILSWNGTTVSDVVVWDNLVHDNGDVSAGFDQDVHGIAISANAHHIWVVDNQLYRNSGDGIQINAGSLAKQATTHHIFVGRNTSHDNKQSGFWTKQAVDVVFSQNTSYAHRAGNSSLGACMGGQYAPEHVWFIDNVMWDSDFGIQLASDGGLGTGRASFFIGNVIVGIHDSNNDFQTGTAWQNCGISLPGGINRYVIENSMYDVDSGVCTPYAVGTLYLYDNAIEKVRANGHHVVFDSPAMAAKTSGTGNLFAPNYKFGVGGVETTFPAASRGAVGSNSAVASIGFTNPTTSEFTLLAASPAVGYGTTNKIGIWEYYLARYGVRLSLDRNGVRRDTSATLDSGASER